MDAANNIQTHTEAVVQAFRDAFTDIWNRIPESERLLILAYWHGPREPQRSSDPRWLPHPKPLIQIVFHDHWMPAPPVCNKLGHELNFSACLVLEQPYDIRKEISQTLAKVLMLATRRRWTLTLKIIEEPLERWERQKGGRVTDASRD